MSNSIYDPIAQALNLDPIHHNFDKFVLMSSGRLDHRGELNPFYGLNHTEDSKKKMSETRIREGTFKGENNPMFGKSARPMLGKKHSEESKKKMSISAKKRGANRTGAFTEEQKKNISKGLLARPIIKCPHCSMESKNNANMVRYHFDNCKFKVGI